MWTRALMILCLVMPSAVAAHEKQDKAKQELEARIPKVVRAVRSGEPIDIDGRLKEKAWQSEGYSDFVMSDPIDGGRPTEKTTVWVAYDDANIFIAAYCYDSEPKSICSRCRRFASRSPDWRHVPRSI